MKIKEGFELRTLCDEHIIVGCGRKNIDFSKVVNLNESAALMWNAVVGKEFTVADMAAALTAEYDVDEKTALADAQRIVAEWVEIGIAE
ncbi:MAG: PqqD family protein [Bacteroidaceae bacterium]|nr:PqqD family protein [Bacteroidaceae bacterium]